MTKKKSFKKNMAILACLALVSLCLPASSSPSDEASKDSTVSMTYYARALLLSSISVNLIKDEPDEDQNSDYDSRIIQGNSKSKKKPINGGD